MPWFDRYSKHAKGKMPPHPAAFDAAGEDVWIEVIRKMDEVYADLLQSQTQLEQQNARLEEAQAFIGSVLASMTDVLIVCDTEGLIQQVNPALERLTGKSEAELSGKLLDVILHPTSLDKLDGFQERLNGGGQLNDCEVSLAAPNGQVAPLSMNCTTRRDHKNRLVGFVLVGRPVGELRRAYEQLDKAHQQLTQTQQQLVMSEKMAALGRLVAGVAHELNNPISFIFGNMHALKRYGGAITHYLESCDQSYTDPQLQELRKQLKIDQIIRDISPLVEGTLEGAERVSYIVKDLLRFSSNQEETPEQVDLVQLARTAADWVVKAKRIKPAVRFDMPNSLEIVGHKGLMHQIIVNLVQNAADVLTGHPAPLIEIACRRQNGYVAVEIADNGTGIPEDKLDKIFEPFFTTKPIGQGTGLGLYVSYSMVQKQGGTLQVANRPQGGAIFTLRMPVNENSLG